MRVKNFQLPDLSHPKWTRRDKLTAMNFANKGKSGFRYILDHDKRQNINKRPVKGSKVEEALPKEKIDDQSRGSPTEFMSLYQNINSINPQIFQLSARERQSAIYFQNINSLFEKMQLNQSKESSETALVESEVTFDDFRTLIHLNAKTKRLTAAEKSLQLMKNAQLSPTIRDYNQILNLYSEQSDLKSTLLFYKQIPEQPDASTMNILIKSFIKNKKTKEAFLIYEEMKNKNLIPTEHTFSLLMQACLNAGDFERGLSLFNYMKSNVCSPGNHSFATAIHLCAKNGKPNQALRLYREMTSVPVYKGKPLKPDFVTYHCLLSACARSPQHYQDTFDLCQQMISDGYEPNNVTYNYLLMASAQQADIWRAKALWKEMWDKANLEQKKDLSPTTQSYVHLLSCYQRLPSFIMHLKKQQKELKELQKWENQKLKSQMGLLNEERMQKGKLPVDLDQWALNEDFDPNQSFQFPQIPKEQLQKLSDFVLEGKSSKDRIESFKQEALGFVDFINKKIESNELQVNSHLLNALIDLYGSFNMPDQLLKVYNDSFSLYQQQKIANTYNRTLLNIFKTKPKRAVQTAWRIFKDFEKFRTLQQWPDDWQELEKKYIKNKWQEKGITHFDRKTEYFIYKNMVQGLTEARDYDKATYLLSQLVQRGHTKILQRQHIQSKDEEPVDLVEKQSENEKTNEISKLLETLSSQQKKLPLNQQTPITPRFQSESATEFSPEHFTELLRKTRTVGRMDLASQIEKLLRIK